MYDQTEREIDELLRESMKTRMDCCLCQKPADMRGVFIPTSQEFSEKLGSPKGKTRVVIYPICKSCMQDPFGQVKAEDWLLKQAAIVRN